MTRIFLIATVLGFGLIPAAHAFVHVPDFPTAWPERPDPQAVTRAAAPTTTHATRGGDTDR